MTPPVVRFVALVAVGIASIGWPAGSSLAGECLRGTLADAFLAEQAGFEREWLVQAPFDTERTQLEKITIADGLLIGQSGDGGVVAVSTAAAAPGMPLPGTVLWCQGLGGSGPIVPASVGPDLVLVARDNVVAAFERATGSVRWQQHIGGLSDAGPVAAGGWVYIPRGTSRILRLPANPHRFTPTPPRPTKQTAASKKKKNSKEVRRPVESLDPVSIATGGRLCQQPEAFNNGLLWCTEEGKLVALEPSNDGWHRNEFELGMAAAGRPLVHDGAIYVATVEGDLARIESLDTQGGGLQVGWQVLLETEPDGELFISGDKLFVSLSEQGIEARSTESGSELWRSPLRGRIVAVSGGRVWIFDRVGKLSSLDAATGECLAQFCLGGFTFPVVNQVNDRLILATPGGAIASLKPVSAAVRGNP